MLYVVAIGLGLDQGFNEFKNVTVAQTAQVS